MTPHASQSNVYHLVSETPALMPHDIPAEEAVLGGLILDPNAIARIEDILKPGDFYLDKHKKIYTACGNIHRKGDQIDLVTLESELSDMNALEAAGGRMAIAHLLDATMSAVNIDQYAALVLDKAKRRALILVSSEMSRLGHNTRIPLAEAIDRAEELVFSVTHRAKSKGPQDMRTGMANLFSEIEQRAESGVPPGLASGFYDLDQMTQGFQRGDLIILAGRPSMGKTAATLCMARNIAKQHALPVLIFSLEMGAGQLNNRLISMESEIDSGRLRAGRVGNDEWSPLGHAINKISELPIFIEENQSITLSEMRSTARTLKAQQSQLGCIIIDYLQLMGDESDNRVQELAKITRSLKKLARELDVPVILLSQLSRDVERRTNKRPVLSDLRSSGAIEQDADLVLMLYRDEYYNPDTSDRGIAEVIVSKHRNGPTGTVNLLFNAPFTKFLNRARGTVL